QFRSVECFQHEIVRYDCHHQKAKVQREKSRKARGAELGDGASERLGAEQLAIVVVDDKTAQHEEKRHAVHCNESKIFAKARVLKLREPINSVSEQNKESSEKPKAS